MRPSRALLKTLGRLGEIDPARAHDIQRALDDFVSVDELAKVLDDGLVHSVREGGRIDLREFAAYVLGRIREHQFTAVTADPRDLQDGKVVPFR